jgi:hypothetical protein
MKVYEKFPPEPAPPRSKELLGLLGTVLQSLFHHSFQYWTQGPPFPEWPLSYYLATKTVSSRKAIVPSCFCIFDIWVPMRVHMGRIEASTHPWLTFRPRIAWLEGHEIESAVVSYKPSLPMRSGEISSRSYDFSCYIPKRRVSTLCSCFLPLSELF